MDKSNRNNWMPYRRSDGRYIVFDSETLAVIDNAQGYGYKTEAKCWNWIRNQQNKANCIIKEDCTCDSAKTEESGEKETMSEKTRGKICTTPGGKIVSNPLF